MNKNKRKLFNCFYFSTYECYEDYLLAIEGCLIEWRAKKK